MKKAYLRVLESVPDPDEVVSLPHASLGRLLLLGKELAAKIAEYIHALRLAGGIVNRSIVQAVAKGMVAHSNPSQLQEQGGHLQIGVKWAEFS